ncbi:NAD(P)-dependent dehydrogenase, short-chain alcohol dehydrogenase family [Oryzisolibacter propanilivorax]|uniref:NAD(P)-dependent dehydrogenase, short-chain alcohol dehydrogenase family n=1 Tax=Oryzisolibacter propanilivorax TaxID=1527607 RepID=A0A1G9RHJ5_9BURK|nr:SDR family oxidoreductase [Oryzisolibacter propanilivorax]SDM22530.1 NAD(P)-dependent dehydrogenase, short-chain alcohol dehydrogenase family [Oryzisolibacter propanilivorax]
MPQQKSSSDTRAAEAAAREQQGIQQQQDAHDAASSKKAAGKQKKKEQESKPAPGPGRDEPSNPLPSQHLDKPGVQQDMELQPRFQAPHYQGSGKLKGMKALITGGDSGIGRAVAVLFAREGADVAIVYLNEHEDAKETCRLIEAEGGRSLAIAGDVKDAKFCARAVKDTVGKFGGLNLLVNNAAFQEHAKALEDLTEERLDETFRTNIFGYFHMAQAALPHLQRGDAIVNTGSVTGLRGSKHLLDYSATKGAIHAFTKALAENLVDKGIRVNAVAPGPVWTPLNPADKPADEIPQFGADTQMGRPAQPEEIAPAYVFLAAPSCSSYITGIVLPITGNAGDGA